MVKVVRTLMLYLMSSRCTHCNTSAQLRSCVRITVTINRLHKLQLSLVLLFAGGRPAFSANGKASL